MNWPFIARSSHEVIVRLLQVQVDELKAERTVLYDRLGAIGLGGPLFVLPEQPEVPAEEEVEPTEEEQEQATMQRLRRTPSKLAAYLTQKAYRDRNKLERGPMFAPDPRMQAALDKAEADGKKAVNGH